MTPEELDALLIGGSLPMRKLKALIPRVAASTLPVLIEGETGTGKELVARALHACSGRKGPLVTLNVCAIADTMFEASMFGHTKGAFTGAVRDVATEIALEGGKGRGVGEELKAVHPPSVPAAPCAHSWVSPPPGLAERPRSAQVARQAGRSSPPTPRHARGRFTAR